jgi:hypothetical protein
LWDVTDGLSALSPSERILELEVRSGTTFDRNLNLRVLKYDEWRVKAMSAAYLAIQRKLSDRDPNPKLTYAADRPVTPAAPHVDESVSDKPKPEPAERTKPLPRTAVTSQDAQDFGLFLLSILVCLGLIVLIAQAHRSRPIP